MTEIDLKQLAIDRDPGSPVDGSGGPRRHLLTRYVVPGAILAGVLALVGWMTWGLVFPPRGVTVVALNHWLFGSPVMAPPNPSAPHSAPAQVHQRSAASQSFIPAGGPETRTSNPSEPI